MKTRDASCELNLLVGGRPITEYESNGAIFVEGRKGSEFEVEYKNQTRHRVLVIPAVDGKSVFDGKPATPESKGYIVPAWGSIRIPGWTLDGDNVAKFTFEDKDKSYASQTAEVGEVVQAGVVGVIVFQEKYDPQPIVKHIHHHHHNPYPMPGIRQPWSPAVPTIQPWCSVTMGSVSGETLQTSTALPQNAIRSAMASSLDATPKNGSDPMVSNPAPIEDAFEMGTGFGQKAEFKTSEVKFKKGDMTAQLSLYYDSRRNLEKRGIQVVRRETRYLDELPQAFQGMTGCTPPPGWKG